MKMVREQVGAVGENRGKRNFDLRVVNSFRNSADDVSQRKSQRSSARDTQEEVSRASCETQICSDDFCQQDLEENDGRSIVEETLAFNDQGEPRFHFQVFEDGENRNRI